jgi:hypothetical protein
MEKQKDPAGGSPTADYTTEAVAVAATEAEATDGPRRSRVPDGRALAKHQGVHASPTRPPQADILT